MRLLINVYGTARSGSTMLDLILGNDPKGFSLGEVVNWFYPYRTHHFDIKCGCGVYPCPVWEKLKDIKRKYFYQKVFELLDVDFLVDSSKYLPWLIDNNIKAEKTNSFRVINVCIYKSPISLYYSHWKRGETSIDTTIRAYNDYLYFFKSGLHFVSINYEQMVSDPQGTIKRLCDVIGIPFFERKPFFWEKTHHHLFGSFGTRKQLFAERPSIYKTNYPESFVKIVPGLNQRINADRRLPNIMGHLKSKDIWKINKYPDETNKRLPKKTIRLYYRPKIVRFFKRFAPEYYIDKESMLIKTYRF